MVALGGTTTSPRTFHYGGIPLLQDVESYGIALLRGRERTGLRKRVDEEGLADNCREIETDLERDELFVPGAGVVRSLEEFDALFGDRA